MCYGYYEQKEREFKIKELTSKISYLEDKLLRSKDYSYKMRLHEDLQQLRKKLGYLQYGRRAY